MIAPAKRKTVDYSRFICTLSLICYLLIAATPPHSSASSQGDAVSTAEKELYQLCRSTYAEGKFVDARQHIERFLFLYPESDHADEILFMQAFLQFAIEASTKIYELLIDKYPNSDWIAKSHFQLGQSYYLQGEYDKALDHYGKIIISYSESEVYQPALYWKCKSLIAKGDYQRALPVLRSLEDGVSAEIGRDMVLMSLGSCYRGMKDYESAEASYRSLIDSIPDSQWIPSAYLLLARSLQDRGKLEEAESLYQKVMEDYGRSMEAQRAQEYLRSLSSSKPTPVESQPAVPESVETTRAASYFTIQVGAFSSKRNADNLADRLKKKGYSVRIVRPVPGKSRLHKVQVGTFKTRNAALRVAQKFNKNEQLSAEVVWQSSVSD